MICVAVGEPLVSVKVVVYLLAVWTAVLRGTEALTDTETLVVTDMLVLVETEMIVLVAVTVKGVLLTVVTERYVLRLVTVVATP